MGQPALSLIQIYLKWSKQRKNTACDENREKKTRALRGNVYEIFERTIRLKRIVSGYEIIKMFEKYNAVRTRFTFDTFF